MPNEVFIQYSEIANRQLGDLAIENPKLVVKAVRLVEEAARLGNPLEGTGKPELLKHHGPNIYLRRINDKHRLVYQLEEEKIIILACYGHYIDK